MKPPASEREILLQVAGQIVSSLIKSGKLDGEPDAIGEYFTKLYRKLENGYIAH